MIPRVKAELWTTKAMRSIIFQKNFWLWRQALLPSLDAGWRANDTHTCKSFTTGSSSNWEHRCALRCWFQGCEDGVHALSQLKSRSVEDSVTGGDCFLMQVAA